MPDLLLINGPNLNLLGSREPETYGHETLADIENSARDMAQDAGLSLAAFQSNAEHAIIDQIHAARDQGVQFIIINPGAFTHTSVAIRDALSGVNIAFYEVHISNVHSREPFRRHSYFSDIAVGVVAGLGTAGYRCAISAAIAQIQGV